MLCQRPPRKPAIPASHVLATLLGSESVPTDRRRQELAQDRHLQPRDAAGLPRSGERARQGRGHGQAHEQPAHAVGPGSARGHAQAVARRAAGAHPGAAHARDAGRPRALAAVCADRQRRHGGDRAALARSLSGLRRCPAPEQRGSVARGNGPRDRGAGRARHPGAHERARAPVGPSGLLPGVPACDRGAQGAGLDASVPARFAGRLRQRAEVRVRDLAGAGLALREQRGHGAHGVLRAAAEAAGAARGYPPLRRDDPLLRGTRRHAVGATGIAQCRQQLRGRAQAPGEEADRVLQAVLRRHGAGRLGRGAALRPGFLRHGQGGVRERLSLRSGRRPHVHPRGHPLHRGAGALRRGLQEGLPAQRAEAARNGEQGMKYRVRVHALAAAAAALVARALRAQGRNLTLVVPYTPGSGPDAVARTIAPRLAARLGNAVVIENKAGASGNIGADAVAKAKPDGNTLMVTVNTFNVTPALYKKLPYDPIADFTPIARLGVSNLALVVNASVPAQNLEQLVALVKSRPGALSYSSPGAGTTPHLAMEVFKKKYGLDILHVPYRGSSGATTDLVGGQTQLMMIPVHTGLPFVRQGKLRMLAVVRDTRSPFAPDVPSLGEFGAKGLDLEVVFWLAGPEGLAPSDVARLNREVTGILALPEVKEAFALQGITPEGSTPAQLNAFIH